HGPHERGRSAARARPRGAGGGAVGRGPRVAARRWDWGHMGRLGAPGVIGDLIGQDLPPGGRTNEQARIDEFAHATDDPQWIHTDPDAAAAGPFGTTIAHGFPTPSLVLPLVPRALSPPRRCG